MAERPWDVGVKESLLSLERVLDGAVGWTRSVYITHTHTAVLPPGECWHTRFIVCITDVDAVVSR